MIKKINITSFGGISGKTVEFDDGLNLVYAPNEGGKSTITSFVSAMLFGIPLNKAKGIIRNPRKKWRPFQNPAFMGSMEYHDGEEEYLIEREFGLTPARDKIKVTNQKTGESVPHYCEDFGWQFFKISKETFENTALVHQGEGQTNKNDEIIAKITNIVSGGAEDLSIQKSLVAIKGEMDTLRKRNSKNGRLDLAENELDSLEREKTRLIAQMAECEELMEREQSLDSRINTLKMGIDSRELIKKGKAYEKYIILKNEIGNLESKNTIMQRNLPVTRDYVEQTQKVFLELKNMTEKHSETLNDLKCQQRVVAELQNEIKNLPKNVEEGLKIVEENEKLLEKMETLAPFLESKERYEKKLDEMEKEGANGGIGGKQSAIVLGISLLLIALGFGISLPTISLVGVIGCAIALLLFVGANVSKTRGQELFDREKANIAKELEEILKMVEGITQNGSLPQKADVEKEIFKILEDMGVATKAELAQKAKSAQELTQRSIFEGESLQKIEAQAKEQESVLEGKNQEFSAMSTLFMTKKETLDGYEIAITAALRDLSTLAQNKILKEEKQKYLADEFGELDEKKAKDDYNEYITLKRSGKLTDDEQGDENEQIIKLEREKTTLKNKIEVLQSQSLAEVEELICEKMGLVKTLTKRYNACKIAYDALENAMAQMSRNFAPRITALVSEIILGITNKYSDVKIDKDYNITVMQDGALKELDYFSGGTIDQIYLSLRLALLDVVSDQKPLPLIFDDAFCYFDDKRLENFLEILVEFAKKRQIIILTCQKREMEILAKYGNFKKIVLE